MTSIAVVVDCADPDRLARFWTAALGYDEVGGVAQYRAIGPSETGAAGPKLIFQQVPEPKSGKNRLHLDLDLDAGVPLEPEVQRLVVLGAATTGAVVEEFGMSWQVLTDPEGNEFCVVARAEGR